MAALVQPRSSRRGGPGRAGAARLLPRFRPGLSLAELLVSLVLVAILMTTIGSVMVLAGHSVGLTVSHAGESAIDDVVATISAEQRLASKITERTPKSITFVLDRNGDGSSDTIRYAWSGIPGDPLTRQINALAPVVLVKDVRRFNLSYLTKTSAMPAPVPDVEVASDVLLYSHTAGSSSAALTAVAWAAEYFKPDWTTVAPGKTVTAWRITKVEVWAAKSSGSIGVLPWVVRLYDAGTDLKPVLANKRDEQSLSVTSTTAAYLSSGAFTANADLDKDKAIVVVLGPNTTSPSGTVGLDTASTDAGGAYMPWTPSLTGGTAGSVSSTRDLKIRVWGRYKYPGP